MMAKKRTAASYGEFHEQAIFAQRLLLDPRTKHLPWTSTLTGANLTVIQAILAKRKGVRRGVPDWMLFVQGGPGWKQVDSRMLPPGLTYFEGLRFYGLALEFKRPDGNGRTTPDQTRWHNALRENGWRVEVVRSAGEAWAVVSNYLAFKAAP